MYVARKFHQVIQEYEKLIKELTSDIDVYKVIIIFIWKPA